MTRQQVFDRIKEIMGKINMNRFTTDNISLDRNDHEALLLIMRMAKQKGIEGCLCCERREK